MAIKTFDANRVGGGTYQLEQDATGAYRIKEVGFVKLPDLKLPEIDQAAYTAPPSDDDGDTTIDPCPPGFKLVNGVCQRIETSSGGSGGEGSQNNFDYTGATQLANIQKDATEFASKDMGLNRVDRTDINQGAIQVEGLREKEAYDKAVANYNAIAERNRDLAMGKQSLSDEDRLQNKADIDAARNEMDKARQNFEGTFETIKAAPKIADFSEGPKTVPTGTLTGAKVEDIGKTFRSDTDKFKTRFDPTKIEPADTSNVLSKAKDIVSNFKPVSLIVAEAVLGVNEVDEQRQKNAKSFFDNVSSKNYKTRGELGSNTDPGRLAGDPTVDLFAGMNKVSAKGNLEEAGANRIDTRNNTIDRRGIKDKAYADANGLKYDPNGMSADFHRNTKGMEVELNEMRSHNNNENIKSAEKKGIDTSTLNPNEMRNVAETGDPGGDPSGKIVCTMMNQRYGFGSFRNKIWLKFHKDYSPEYQKGYHKVFLPLVNIAKKEGIFNTIVRKILEHMGRHVTADMFQVMRNKKSDKLGRIYRKIFEPICYWLGGK